MTTASDFFVASLPGKSVLPDLQASVGGIDPQDFRSADGFAYRVEPHFLTRLSTPEAADFRRTAIERLAPKPLFVVAAQHSQQTLILKQVKEAGLVSPHNEAELLAHIRSSELRHLVAAAGEGCFHRSEGMPYHFVTPSELHCSLFFRVGDLVGTKDALDALSFWLAPVVSPASAVLLDTWGISLILQASLMRLPKTLAWDALRIHPSHDRLAARKTLENLVSDVPKGSTVIFLESLHISGRMWNLMQLVFEELGRPDLKLQAHAMFNFKNSDAAVRPLCELHETIEKYESQETCRLCEKGSPRFRIDPKVYYLREVSQTPVFFEKGHYATGREFVDRYKDVPAAFRLHRQDPNDGRHHAFDIDVLTLLENNTFLDRLDKHLDAIESPDVIVVPNHEPGTRLGEIASSKFKRPLVIHDNLRPDSKLKDADSRLLKDSRHILILDDVLNSGSRLHKYNKTLRESGYAPFDRVSYVVAVARPQSEAEWKHHRASLTMHHDWAATLTGVEKIYLPRWKRNECPWCKEEILLASISSPFPSAPKWISDRTQKLADTEYGLNRDIFLSVPPAETSSLGASSDFGPQGLSPVATTFCVVSALQELRNGPAPDKQLRPNFPNFNVFNIKKCLELYDEALLRAIFLRVVVASEWGELARRELGKFLPPELLKPDHAQVRGETLVCMYRNGLRIDPAEFHSAFSPHLTADEETILVKTLGISQTAPNFQ